MDIPHLVHPMTRLLCIALLLVACDSKHAPEGPQKTTATPASPDATQEASKAPQATPAGLVIVDSHLYQLCWRVALCQLFRITHPGSHDRAGIVRDTGDMIGELMKGDLISVGDDGCLLR